MKKLFSIYIAALLLVTCGLIIAPRQSSASGSASLYLTTTCGPNINRITVKIHENSGSTAVNGVQSNISYSSSQFNVISVTGGASAGSPFTTIAQNDTGTAGLIKYAAGTPGAANTSGDQIVASIVFQARTGSGSSTVAFTNTGLPLAVTADDGSGTNILTSTTSSIYPMILTNTCGFSTVTNTFVPHPSGTLFAFNGHVFLNNRDSNGEQVKSLITNGDVFASYGYPWSKVKTATTGDANLPNGASISTLAPGTIFHANGTPVYVMTYESGNLVKQQISLSAFNSLGYHWSEVQLVSPGSVPAATASGILYANQHPAGTLVSGNGRIYQIGQSTKNWVLSPAAIATNYFSYSKVKSATSLDLALANGSSVNLRQGSMLTSNNNIYVVDYDGSGILKRPVGPWYCFSNRWHYTSSDLYQIASSALPARTGALATC
jgi:hypothetical protein